MVLILKVLLMIIGMILPVSIGYPCIRILLPNLSLSRLEHFIISFLIGWMIFSAIFAIAGFANFGFNFIGGLTIICSTSGICFLTSRKHLYNQNISHSEDNIRVRSEEDKWRGGWHKSFKYLLVLFAITLFVFIMLKSIVNTNSMPMHAVWGYKAMLFFKEGMIPLSFFTNPDISFTHQSYPLLFPIMLTWGYMCIGEVYEPFAKLIPPLLGVLVYLSIYAILRREKVSRFKTLGICLLFCGSSAFILSSTILYSENLLILYVLWGIYFLYKYIKLSKKTASCIVQKNDLLSVFFISFLLLAGGGWVKNEGILYFGLAMGFMLIIIILPKLFRILSKKESTRKQELYSLFFCLAAIIIPAFVFIVPWQLFRYSMGISVLDFSITDKIHAFFQCGFSIGKPLLYSGVVLRKSLLEFLNAMFVNIKLNCGVWYSLILLFFISRKQLLQKEKIFLLYIIFTSITTFSLSFIFSTRPMYWHMVAIPRLLLIPSLLSWLLIIFPDDV